MEKPGEENEDRLQIQTPPTFIYFHLLPFTSGWEIVKITKTQKTKTKTLIFQKLRTNWEK